MSHLLPGADVHRIPGDEIGWVNLFLIAKHLGTPIDFEVHQVSVFVLDRDLLAGHAMHGAGKHRQGQLALPRNTQCDPYYRQQS